jgi:hypothetical protein
MGFWGIQIQSKRAPAGWRLALSGRQPRVSDLAPAALAARKFAVPQAWITRLLVVAYVRLMDTPPSASSAAPVVKAEASEAR